MKWIKTKDYLIDSSLISKLEIENHTVYLHLKDNHTVYLNLKNNEKIRFIFETDNEAKEFFKTVFSIIEASWMSVIIE
jgi:hypothetical protein